MTGRTGEAYYSGSTPNPQAARLFGVLRERVLLRTQDFASVEVFRRTGDVFRTLVVTILSQNSTDVNALRAYKRLDRAVGISPKTLARAPVRAIERAIAVGGLQRTKSRGLKQLARQLLTDFQGDLSGLLQLPLDQAREALTSLPTIGPKTADVLLVTVRGQDTVPVDTHVSRVSRRLGLAPVGGNYEAIRASLQALYPPRDYHELHLRLIAFGRSVCTARRPRCPVCPVRQYCPFPNKTVSGAGKDRT